MPRVCFQSEPLWPSHTSTAVQVGNLEFANWVDRNLQVTHVNNKYAIDPLLMPHHDWSSIQEGLCSNYPRHDWHCHIHVTYLMPVITLTGKALGYHHPSGEIHINEMGQWESCPGLSARNLHIWWRWRLCFAGQDNPSKSCIVGDVPSVLKGDEGDHDGPYNGVVMGCLRLT